MKCCVGFLASVIDIGKVEVKLLDDPIINEFPNVLLEDLPRIHPDCEIEYNIELFPRTISISKTSYRLTPIELKELKEQLQENYVRRVSFAQVFCHGALLCCLSRRMM